MRGRGGSRLLSNAISAAKKEKVVILGTYLFMLYALQANYIPFSSLLHGILCFCVPQVQAGVGLNWPKTWIKLSLM